MIFLIHYERQNGLIIDLQSYADSEKHEAEEARLSLELELRRTAIAHEVVLLEALDEEALRKTHRRYFENWDALASNQDLKKKAL